MQTGPISVNTWQKPADGGESIIAVLAVENKTLIPSRDEVTLCKANVKVRIPLKWMVRGR